MNTQEYTKIFENYKNSKTKTEPIKEDFGSCETFKPEAWEKEEQHEPSCGCQNINASAEGPESFSDTIRDMPVSELLNQIKGTDEGLYRKLVYYIRDTYHEGEQQSDSNEFENPISIEDIMGASGMGMSPIKTISVMSHESKKGPSTDLMVESFKALKAVKK